MIEWRQLCVQRSHLLLEGIQIQVPRGQYATLVGPSGSGKTTLLEATVGLFPISHGQVVLNERDVSGLRPDERRVAYVPQDLALFGWKSVASNIGFGLNLQRLCRDEARRRISETAEALQLTSLLAQRANRLSRGQAQRVAIGRAIVMRPSILIMDEPLNSLDDATKSIVICALRALQKEFNPTVLHVTHQPNDLIELSNYRFRLENGMITCDQA